MDFEARVRELHQSETYSLSKAAQLLGVSRFHLKDIINAMGLVWPKVSRGGKHTVNGITDTLENHAKRHNTTVAGIRWSLQRGLPIGPKRFKPVTANEALNFIIFQQEGNNVKVSAEKVGRPTSTLRRAVKKYFPDGVFQINERTMAISAANESESSQTKRRA